MIAYIALAVSIVALVCAFWSARSSSASADAAKTTAALDSDRRHDQLTPQFEITASATGGDYGRLSLKLTGPTGLGRLDEVVVAILDEAGINHRGHGFPPLGVSEEEARRFVWGPWQFDTNASAEIDDNRTSRPRPYALSDGNNWGGLRLERTRPGSWMGLDLSQWRMGDSDKGPIRLGITCRRGDDEWSLPPCEIYPGQSMAWPPRA